ncbi:hypothetical protein D9M68_229880 [compost metagenome]
MARENTRVSIQQIGSLQVCKIALCSRDLVRRDALIVLRLLRRLGCQCALRGRQPGLLLEQLRFQRFRLIFVTRRNKVGDSTFLVADGEKECGTHCFGQLGPATVSALLPEELDKMLKTDRGPEFPNVLSIAGVNLRGIAHRCHRGVAAKEAILVAAA